MRIIITTILALVCTLGVVFHVNADIYRPGVDLVADIYRPGVTLLVDIYQSGLESTTVV